MDRDKLLEESGVLNLLGNTSIKEDVQENFRKWITEPVLKYPLAPREARAILEVFGQLSARGLSIKNLLNKVFQPIKSDLDCFVELYSSLGIACAVERKNNNDLGNYQCICLEEGDCEKLNGYYGFCTIIYFDENGAFIKQGFYE